MANKKKVVQKSHLSMLIYISRTHRTMLERAAKAAKVSMSVYIEQAIEAFTSRPNLFTKQKKAVKAASRKVQISAVAAASKKAV